MKKEDIEKIRKIMSETYRLSEESLLDSFGKTYFQDIHEKKLKNDENFKEIPESVDADTILPMLVFFKSSKDLDATNQEKSYVESYELWCHHCDVTLNKIKQTPDIDFSISTENHQLVKTGEFLVGYCPAHEGNILVNTKNSLKFVDISNDGLVLK